MMNKNVYSYTDNLVSTYPEYISINKLENDDLFEITIRSAPYISKCRYICGYDSDRGKRGICIPGDENCNNYCNLAPQKGKMAKIPKDYENINPGDTTKIVLNFDKMIEIANAILEFKNKS